MTETHSTPDQREEKIASFALPGRPKVRFTVATNFDPKLPALFSDLNAKHAAAQIFEIWGSLPVTLVGHGRSSWGLPQVSRSQLRDHIKAAHDCGLAFNYLLNGYCSESQKSDSSWVAAVTDEVKKLAALDIDAVTVTDPWLIRLVRRECPELPVKLSLIAAVDTPEKALDYERLGVSGITLNAVTVNRDIIMIQRIMDAVTCPIQLYANISCLDHCPKRDAHYHFVTKHSRLDSSIVSAPGKDPYISWCLGEYRREKTALLRTPFIRPNDIALYSQLGIASFKLSDRKMPTDTLVLVADTYLRLQDPPDLFPLIFGEGSGWLNETEGVAKASDLPVIDSSVLTELGFFQNATGLKGEALVNFYERATDCAVRGTGFWQAHPKERQPVGSQLV